MDENATETESDGTNRELVEGFFAASERGEMATLATMVDDQMVMTWPQSGAAEMRGGGSAAGWQQIFADQLVGRDRGLGEAKRLEVRDR